MIKMTENLNDWCKFKIVMGFGPLSREQMQDILVSVNLFRDSLFVVINRTAT